MKKSDIAMIIFIASVSVLVSYFVVSSIPALKSSNKPVQVKTIEKYSADISEPDPTVFSKDAINPTVQVTIGGESEEQGSNSGTSND